MTPTYTRLRQILPPLGAAAAGGYAVQRIGLPVGWLVGSMLVTAAIQALRVIFVSLTMPVLIRRALRRSNGHPSKELSPWK